MGKHFRDLFLVMLTFSFHTVQVRSNLSSFVHYLGEQLIASLIGWHAPSGSSGPLSQHWPGSGPLWGGSPFTQSSVVIQGKESPSDSDGNCSRVPKIRSTATKVQQAFISSFNLTVGDE